MGGLWIFCQICKFCLAKRKGRYFLLGLLLVVGVMTLVVKASLELGASHHGHRQQGSTLLGSQRPRAEVYQRQKQVSLKEHRVVDFQRARQKEPGEKDTHGHYIDQVADQLAEKPLAEEPSFHHQGHDLRARNLTNGTCEEWVSRAPKPPYFLTAVLLVRIYAHDKAKLTTKEMKMWLQYLRYAGVEHVYVYDAWVKESESQLGELEIFLSEGYVTYEDWHTHNPYTISGTQVASYQHCIDHYGHESQWQAAIDIDEYPFSPADISPGFLHRYMKDFSIFHKGISEVTMQNFLYLGKPLEKELMIERLLRRTPKPANPLVKPIYRPKDVRASVHHNALMRGRSMNAPVKELRMNHYWGARLQDWGDDTEEILARTVPDDSMRPIINAFKKCETQVRRYLD